MEKDKSKKIKLFDDVDDDGVDEQFDLKIDEKLNDRKTSKLIELQSKFAYDSRFKVDERFLDDNDEDENETKVERSEIEEEKLKNIEILEQVLGKKISDTSHVNRGTFDKKSRDINSAAASNLSHKSILTPRFDPSKEECKIFELPQEELKSKRKLPKIDFDKDYDEKVDPKKVRFNVEEKDKKTKTKDPILSENYYEVSSNLKESLFSNQNEDFSFGSLLGLDEGADLEKSKSLLQTHNETSLAEPIGNEKKMFPTKNPFHYDSSDSEREDDNWNEKNEAGEKKDDDGEKYSENGDDQVQIKLPSKFKSQKRLPAILFSGFFFDTGDKRLEQDLFYTPELVQKATSEAKDRQIQMMRALSFRKRSALKNVKSDKKYTAKRKLLQMARKKHHKRFPVQRSKST